MSTGMAIQAEPQWVAREMDDSDVGEICTWARNREALALVGSESAECLTGTLLAEWASCSVRALTLWPPGDRATPVGFCTMSVRESIDLPRLFVEMCHLMVSPQAKYAWVACRLIDEVRLAAAELGFRQVVGRVHPLNERMLIIAGFKGGQRYEILPQWAQPGFVWLSIPSGRHRPRRRRLST